jgi:hypothetical protein
MSITTDGQATTTDQQSDVEKQKNIEAEKKEKKARAAKLKQGMQALYQHQFDARDDFTFLLTKAALIQWLGDKGEDDWLVYCSEKSGASKKKKTKGKQFEFQDTYKLTTEDKGQIKTTNCACRLQVSRCYGDQAWSVTVRPADKPTAASLSTTSADATRTAKEEGGAFVRGSNLSDSKWKPEELDANGAWKKNFLFPLHFGINSLWEALHLDPAVHPSGLILMSGATATAKSGIARGLAYKYLEAACIAKPARIPHLLTYEDPIEKYFWNDVTREHHLDNPLHWTQSQIDYTPRQLVKDTLSLDEVLRGALRQTPALVYVGEIRTSLELHQALEFGGTGHLIMATVHAGSLVETVAKVFNAVGASDSGTRAIYASKLRAAIHLERFENLNPVGVETKVEGDTLATVIPTIYRNTSAGLQGLVADGLSSLLPYSNEDPSLLSGTIGRTAMAKLLLQQLPDSDLKKYHSTGIPSKNSKTVRNAFSLIDLTRRSDFNGR